MNKFVRMAMRFFDSEWYDIFYLNMLFMNTFLELVNRRKNQCCDTWFQTWLGVDFMTMLIFRFLMCVNNTLGVGMGLDHGWQRRFYLRIAVISVLALLLYPFLWAWTVTGTLWFITTKNCFPVRGQKLAFLCWLLFNYCGLVLMAWKCLEQWLTRRQAHLLRNQQRIPISEFGVLVDMIRVPCWVLEEAERDMRWLREHITAYHPELHMTAALVDSEWPTAIDVSTNQYMRTQPPCQSYLLRLQGSLLPVRTENIWSGGDGGVAATETAGNSEVVATDYEENTEPVQVPIKLPSPTQR